VTSAEYIGNYIRYIHSLAARGLI